MRTHLAAFVIALAIASPAATQPMLVSTDWLQANLFHVKLVDVGDRTSYNAGHIPRATLVESSSIVTDLDGVPNELPPIDKLEAVFRNAGVGDSGRIVLYSRDPLLATRAFFTLDYLGHGYRTSVLDGGFAKWTAEGRTTSTIPPIATADVFQAQVRPGTITRLQTMTGLVRYRDTLRPTLVLIDARDATQFDQGHIPGAIDVPWSENFTTGAVPVFRPAAELRAIYESAGVTRESSNVVYCRTGMQATVTYFVLQSLGYEATLYDGSYSEWCKAGCPVE